MRPVLTVFFLLIFAFSTPAFPVSPALPTVQTYDELLHAIRETRVASKKRIEQAVEQEKVREAWETGKLIDEHVLQHKERADYGTYVIKRLAGDLEMDRTELYRMLEFARLYPIVVPGQQLSWSHYKALLPIEDPKEREAIAKEAARESWDRDRLREEIRRRRLSKNPGEIVSGPPRRLEAQKGMLDTYRILMLEGRLQIGLGFSNYLELSEKDAKRFKEGDIVRVSKGKLELVKGATESLVPLQIFSYRVTILEITDGDTFWALVHLGFGVTTKQQLRLRGLDAPEIESSEGKEAKVFLESVIAGLPATNLGGRAKQSGIVIRAVKSDKYDRYLTDVWVGEKYLNQTLIDNGLAVRVSE